MKYRNMGKTGLKISEVSLGAWLTYGGSVDDNTASTCVTAAIESGVNFIDIADIYARGKAEEVIGDIISDENYDRKDLVISSKVFWPMSKNINDKGLSRKHIMESIEVSLERLGTDYLDIYFCHRYDRYTPLEETVEAMSDLVDSGLVHYWGTSVWSAVQLERATWVAKDMGSHPPRVEQPRYNMLDRFIERDVLEVCRHHGIGLVIWSPLAQGLLTGKYADGIPEGSRAATTDWLKREMTPENIEKVRNLTGLAKEKGMSMNQMALAWILRLPEISSVITGATKPDHVNSNIKASEVILDEVTLEKIGEILGNKPKRHPIYNPPW
ncbi:MAG: aldo/keto reductase family protein [Candidatus Hodarchaeales archaeon]|jgi:voltage-dependent potassium channel beta subunit